MLGAGHNFQLRGAEPQSSSDQLLVLQPASWTIRMLWRGFHTYCTLLPTPLLGKTWKGRLTEYFFLRGFERSTRLIRVKRRVYILKNWEGRRPQLAMRRTSKKPWMFFFWGFVLYFTCFRRFSLTMVLIQVVCHPKNTTVLGR